MPASYCPYGHGFVDGGSSCSICGATPIPAVDLAKEPVGGQYGSPPRYDAPVFGQHGVPYQPSPQTNSMAIVAFVLVFVGGVLAIPFGHVARSQIRRTGERGEGLAVAALILGYLSLIVWLAVVGFWLFVFAGVASVANDAGSSVSYPAVVVPALPRTTETEEALPSVLPQTSVARPAPSYPVGITGADSQGFLTDGARCNYTNPAVALVRTEQSLIAICETGVGRYYYRGIRVSDGAGIELDDPVPTGSGFVARNGTVVYSIDPTAFTIYDGTEQLTYQPVLEYWQN